jgi:hypothetical protein
VAGRSFFTFRQFISNISKKDGNQNKGCGYLSNGISSPKIIHFSSLLSHHTVTNKNSIPKRISPVNVRRSIKSLGKEIFVPIKGTVNQAADRFMASPENAFNQGWNFFFFLIKLILAPFGNKQAGVRLN